jgi:hypothetical protein
MTDIPFAKFSTNNYGNSTFVGPLKLELDLMTGQEIQVLESTTYQQLVDTQKNMKNGLIILGIVCGILFLLLIFMFILFKNK